MGRKDRQVFEYGVRVEEEGRAYRVMNNEYRLRNDDFRSSRFKVQTLGAFTKPCLVFELKDCFVAFILQASSQRRV